MPQERLQNIEARERTFIIRVPVDLIHATNYNDPCGIKMQVRVKMIFTFPSCMKLLTW